MLRRILLLTRVFRKECHAEEFLRGQIRAETLAYYRGTEDQARSDPQEGIFSSGKDWKVTLKTPDGYAHTLSHEAGERMRIRFNWTDRVNILCTTASYIDTEWAVPDDRHEEVLDRYIRIPEAVKKFGNFAVFVHNMPSFLDLADAAAEKAGLELARGFVDYSGRAPNPKTEELIFCKDSNYKHERELTRSLGSRSFLRRRWKVR